MKIGCVLAILLCSAAFIAAEDWNDSAPKAKHVTVEPVQPVKLTAGRSARAEIRIRVAPGFHINSSMPTSELLIPTQVEISPSPNIKVAKITYPPGEDFVFKAAPSEKLSVYSGDVTFSVLLSDRNSAPGKYTLPAELRYQACDDRSCFPPKSIRLAIPVVVEGR
jgi:thiol:disulfide interchange protein DsbD